jgi:hypothetical protein
MTIMTSTQLNAATSYITVTPPTPVSIVTAVSASTTAHLIATILPTLTVTSSSQIPLLQLVDPPNVTVSVSPLPPTKTIKPVALLPSPMTAGNTPPAMATPPGFGITLPLVVSQTLTTQEILADKFPCTTLSTSPSNAGNAANFTGGSVSEDMTHAPVQPSNTLQFPGAAERAGLGDRLAFLLAFVVMLCLI